MTSSPVMTDESSQARKRTTRAISSVEPRRRNGILASSARCVAAAASAGSSFARIPESVGPGVTTFTRIPRSTSSEAAVRAKRSESGLRACIGAGPWHSLVRVDRGVEDDGASPAEKRDGRLQRKPGAFRVDPEDLVEIRFAQVQDAAHADDPGVEEQDVQPTVLLGDPDEQQMTGCRAPLARRRSPSNVQRATSASRSTLAPPLEQPYAGTRFVPCVPFGSSPAFNASTSGSPPLLEWRSPRSASSAVRSEASSNGTSPRLRR